MKQLNCPHCQGPLGFKQGCNYCLRWNEDSQLCSKYILQLDGLLEEKGGVGAGMLEKAKSIKGAIPDRLYDDLHQVGRARNVVVKEGQLLSNRREWEALAEACIPRLKEISVSTEPTHPEPLKATPWVKRRPRQRSQWASLGCGGIVLVMFGAIYGAMALFVGGTFALAAIGPFIPLAFFAWTGVLLVISMFVKNDLAKFGTVKNFLKGKRILAIEASKRYVEEKGIPEPLWMETEWIYLGKGVVPNGTIGHYFDDAWMAGRKQLTESLKVTRFFTPSIRPSNWNPEEDSEKLTLED